MDKVKFRPKYRAAPTSSPREASVGVLVSWRSRGAFGGQGKSRCHDSRLRRWSPEELRGCSGTTPHPRSVQGTPSLRSASSCCAARASPGPTAWHLGASGSAVRTASARSATGGWAERGPHRGPAPGGVLAARRCPDPHTEFTSKGATEPTLELRGRDAAAPQSRQRAGGRSTRRAGGPGAAGRSELGPEAPVPAATRSFVRRPRPPAPPPT